ncbi:MAG: AAA family ATPase [Saprospiraceae bacterium]|nr:AAA family ATPase [Saprospiraceae bacterium]MBK8370043.1 AAA family ATPase [Saprospiraceae bacterium]
MTLIIISGVSGTGKSSLSNKIGHELSIPVFSIDLIKAFFLKTGLAENGWETVREKGYQLLADFAENQLKLNQSVIIDGVFARKEFRTRLLDIAKTHNAKLKIIACICTDQDTHMQRILNRKRNIEGLPEIEWDYVKKVKETFTEWKDEHLTLDALSTIEENYLLAKKYITS